MYQVWVERVRSHIKFNPKNINKIFKECEVVEHDSREQIVDYNKLVQEYFKQNDTTFYQEREQEAEKPAEEDVGSMYQKEQPKT